MRKGCRAWRQGHRCRLIGPCVRGAVLIGMATSIGARCETPSLSASSSDCLLCPSRASMRNTNRDQSFMVEVAKTVCMPECASGLTSEEAALSRRQLRRIRIVRNQLLATEPPVKSRLRAHPSRTLSVLAWRLARSRSEQPSPPKPAWAHQGVARARHDRLMKDSPYPTAPYLAIIVANLLFVLPNGSVADRPRRLRRPCRTAGRARSHDHGRR